MLAGRGLDTVAGAFAFADGQELFKPGLGARRRVRVDLADAAGRAVRWYLKCYGPEREGPLRRLFARPSPARREYDNIQHLRAAGVPVARAVTFGEEAAGQGRRSYLVVAAVPGEALERCLNGFLARHGLDSPVVRAFNAALVELAANLHAAGFVHRDLYAAHIFMEELPSGGCRLHLIDLARVFRPRWRLFRWRVKDLAALKYSLPAAWVERHWGEFLRRYLQALSVGGAPASRVCARGVGGWSAAIDRKAAWMRRRRWRKSRKGPA